DRTPGYRISRDQSAGIRTLHNQAGLLKQPALLRFQVRRPAALAACVAGGPKAPIKATWLRTRSATKRGQLVVLTIRITIYDLDVLALDIADFFYPTVKGCRHVRRPTLRTGLEEPNHRHRRLLPMRRERPSRRAAECGASRAAVGEHIEVIVIPLARRTGGRGALEDQRHVRALAARNPRGVNYPG